MSTTDDREARAWVFGALVTALPGQDPDEAAELLAGFGVDPAVIGQARADDQAACDAAAAEDVR